MYVYVKKTKKGILAPFTRFRRRRKRINVKDEEKGIGSEELCMVNMLYICILFKGDEREREREWRIERSCYALRDMAAACGIHNFVKTKMLRSCLVDEWHFFSISSVFLFYFILFFFFFIVFLLYSYMYVYI